MLAIPAQTQNILQLLAEYILYEGTPFTLVGADTQSRVLEAYQNEKSAESVLSVASMFYSNKAISRRQRTHASYMRTAVRDWVYIDVLDRALLLGEGFSEKPSFSEHDIKLLIYETENILTEVSGWEHLDDEEQSGISELIMTVFKYGQ